MNRPKLKPGDRKPILCNPPRRPPVDVSAPLLVPKREFHPDTPHQKEWIETLSKNQMNIKVTNIHDNDGPPTSFKWIEDYILDPTIPVIDLDFTPGCSCDVECEIVLGTSCDCMATRTADGIGTLG
jgi:hypothetical protein